MCHSRFYSKSVFLLIQHRISLAVLTAGISLSLFHHSGPSAPLSPIPKLTQINLFKNMAMQPAKIVSAGLKKMVSYSTVERRNSREQAFLELALPSKSPLHNICPRHQCFRQQLCLLNRSRKSCCSMCMYIPPLAHTLTKPRCPVILLSVCVRVSS